VVKPPKVHVVLSEPPGYFRKESLPSDQRNLHRRGRHWLQSTGTWTKPFGKNLFGEDLDYRLDVIPDPRPSGSRAPQGHLPAGQSLPEESMRVRQGRSILCVRLGWMHSVTRNVRGAYASWTIWSGAALVLETSDVFHGKIPAERPKFAFAAASGRALAGSTGNLTLPDGPGMETDVARSQTLPPTSALNRAAARGPKLPMCRAFPTDPSSIW